MPLLGIFLVLLFSGILCAVEVPKMLRDKLYRELWLFSVLLAIGTVLAILKSIGVDIPNPSDWLETLYSPIIDLLKPVLE